MIKERENYENPPKIVVSDFDKPISVLGKIIQ